MNCSEILSLYQDNKPESEIHKAFREVAVDDSDELYDGRTPLHLACFFVDIEAVHILLERGVDVNIKDDNGTTPIYTLGKCSTTCVDEDKLKEIAILLLECGANVPRSGKNATALIEAAKHRHFKMVEAIIDFGVRVNSTDLNGENVLFTLCDASGDIKREIRYARKDLDEAIQYSYPEEKIEDIRTRIKKMEEDDEIAYQLAKRLVDEGKIDPEDKSNSGKTAWDVAIENKAMKIAAMLTGSDPEADEFAARHGNMDIFQAMYSQNMDALDAMLCSGVVLQTICEDKAMSDFEGKSPLGAAFSWFDTLKDVPAMLLKAGADPNYRYPNEDTAFATWIKNVYSCNDVSIYTDLLDLMIEKGWNPEASADKEGNTALSLSCRHSGCKLGETAVNYLLKHKSDVNAVNLFGQIPMMLLYGARPVWGNGTPYGGAVGSDEAVDILEKLLEAGAEPCKTDKWGNTLLHYIAASCCDSTLQKVIDLLLDFRLPDVNAVNNTGMTAMDVAIENNNETLIRLLLKYS